MTQDEIIEITKQAGKHQWPFDPEFLERFAKLVAEKATEEANARANASWTLMCEKMVAIEREACAKLIEKETGMNPHWQKYLSAAIRARGQA